MLTGFSAVGFHVLHYQTIIIAAYLSVLSKTLLLVVNAGLQFYCAGNYVVCGSCRIL